MDRNTWQKDFHGVGLSKTRKAILNNPACFAQNMEFSDIPNPFGTEEPHINALLFKANFNKLLLPCKFSFREILFR
jgi:hypothetical protein